MVYNYLIYLPVALSLFLASIGQKAPAEDKIHWNNSRKLSWQDFKGNPRESSQFSAESSLQISYGLKISQEGGVTNYLFTVDCYFEKKDSWVKPDKKTDALLKHEQIHFDIAEYFARKLRKEFKKNTFTIADYQSKSKAIFNKNFTEYQSYQTAYDEDTRHGSIPEEQAKWEEKVGNLLVKSINYKKM